jgi:hypothetical protein
MLGAINADFFGINTPTDHILFLAAQLGKITSLTKGNILHALLLD